MSVKCRIFMRWYDLQFLTPNFGKINLGSEMLNLGFFAMEWIYRFYDPENVLAMSELWRNLEDENEV